MHAVYDFADIARLPAPEDNVAIATRQIEAGSRVEAGHATMTLSHTVLEGHRFATRPIRAGEELTSWGMRFGRASQDIAPGAYVINSGVLAELGNRNLSFALPPAPNFEDEYAPFTLDEASFTPAPPLARSRKVLTFYGFPRPGGRGTGVRNFIVLLGTTALTGSFVRRAAEQLNRLAEPFPNVDGVVAVAHTEGASVRPNNLDLLLRTLAGFMVHSNVAAIAAVDYGTEPVNNEMLRRYMVENGFPLQDVPHRFLSLSTGFDAGMQQIEAMVREWLPQVDQPRQAAPLSELKIALQCGGSDAFSGVSGNPLAAWVAKEIIQQGGSANLGETDELIGAEAYVLKQTASLETAQKFVETVERFKAWAERHDASAHGNPSGGNKFRGLYNIYLKSLGAAAKRHPDVPLQGVLDYSQPLPGPGFYFMDSPGNDLESIAGQVASGCNLIFFVTGNGSITNFPFAPTIKIVTTSRRYELLRQEMDVNAGEYLDGAPLAECGKRTLDLTIAVASGQRTAGEVAGHAQVQLWRDWPLASNQRAQPVAVQSRAGIGIPLTYDGDIQPFTYLAYPGPNGLAAEQVGLILPTSLCAGQVARMAAEQLNQRQSAATQRKLNRFVALVHTEGCGASAHSIQYFRQTLLAYLRHPRVRHALLLEHGCETTHNDNMRARLDEIGVDPASLGWASIQLDGGIGAVMGRIAGWFDQKVESAPELAPVKAGLSNLRLGVMSAGPLSAPVAGAMASFVRLVVAAGGMVLLPANDPLLESPFKQAVFGSDSPEPTLDFARLPTTSGLHLVDAPSRQWSELMAGMGASGVELVVGVTGDHARPGHPLLPLLLVTDNAEVATDADVRLEAGLESVWFRRILARIEDTLNGDYIPKAVRSGNTDFQISRGWVGISL